MRYLRPTAMQQVRKRLAIIDMLETQAADARAAMLAVIAEDAGVDLVTETWAIDLDAGMLTKEEGDGQPG